MEGVQGLGCKNISECLQNLTLETITALLIKCCDEQAAALERRKMPPRPLSRNERAGWHQKSNEIKFWYPRKPRRVKESWRKMLNAHVARKSKRAPIPCECMCMDTPPGGGGVKGAKLCERSGFTAPTRVDPPCMQW